MGNETPGSGISSKLAQQSMKSSDMMQGMRIAHGAKVKDSGVAVNGFYSLHFRGYGFNRFVPGNPGKFAGAPVALSLKRMENPVGRIDTLSVGMSSRTHSGVPFPVIGLDPNNLIPLNMHLHFAVAAAVAITDGTDYLFFTIGLAFPHFFLQTRFSFLLHNKVSIPNKKL